MIRLLLRNKTIRSSRIVCYFLFGFYPSPKNRKTLWDNTSLVFRKALKIWVKNNDNVLEIGTGDVGLLSNYIYRKRIVNITAVDICNEFVLNSKQNNSEILFLRSNLFSNIDKSEKYDVIFSNPPYVKTSQINPENHMEYHGFLSKEMLYYASDGGLDGIQLLSKIIRESALFLRKDGSLLLGFNQNHLDYKSLMKVVSSSKLYFYSQIESSSSPCIIINLKLESNG